MPNIYITDETKELIETVAKADCRTQDGVINYLCKQRVKELGRPDMGLPSNESHDSNKTRSPMSILTPPKQHSA